MSDTPTGKSVSCPECNETAFAIVPKNSEVVDDDANAGGKVWVNCRSCGVQFLAYYRRRD